MHAGQIPIAKKKKSDSDAGLAVLFIGPTILLILAVSIAPVFLALNTSMRATNFAEIGEFVGLAHYKEILLTANGWKSIFNSITYALGSLIIVIPLGVMAAVLLNRKIRFNQLFRTIIILPWVLSQTVVALLWKWLLNSNFGPVSYVWFKLTGSKADLFNEELTARVAMIFINSWFTFPIVLILVLAALQSIPQEISQAAQVDGANRMDILFQITLPMIKSTILTAVVMQSMEYFSMVTLLLTVTAGGPFGATETISLRAFKEGFQFWHLGLGSAYSIIIFILNICFSFMYVRLLRNQDQ